MLPSEIRTDCIINYVTNVPEWVLRLRGLPYFTWLGVEYVRVDSPAVVNLSPSVLFAPLRTSVIFLIMPMMPGVDVLIADAARRGCPTIVDVTGDALLLLDEPDDDMVIASLESKITYNAHDPGFDERATLARCVRAAKVVTTSWPQLVTPLRELVGHDDVYHLADTHGDQDVLRFDRELAGPFSAISEWILEE